MKSRHSFTADVLAYFKARPNVWIDAGTLQDIGGRFASRTRISEVRKRLEKAGEGTIEWRGTPIRDHAPNCPGLQAWDIPDACSCLRPIVSMDSRYRYVPAVPAEPLTGTPHDLNAMNPGDGRLW